MESQNRIDSLLRRHDFDQLCATAFYKKSALQSIPCRFWFQHFWGSTLRYTKPPSCFSGERGYHAMNNKEKGSSRGCRMNAPTDLMRLHGFLNHVAYRGWRQSREYTEFPIPLCVEIFRLWTMGWETLYPGTWLIKGVSYRSCSSVNRSCWNKVGKQINWIMLWVWLTEYRVGT